MISPVQHSSLYLQMSCYFRKVPNMNEVFSPKVKHLQTLGPKRGVGNNCILSNFWVIANKFPSNLLSPLIASIHSASEVCHLCHLVPIKTIWTWPPPIMPRRPHDSAAETQTHASNFWCVKVYFTQHAVSVSLHLPPTGLWSASTHIGSFLLIPALPLVCKSILFPWLYIHCFWYTALPPLFFWVCYFRWCYPALLTSVCHYLKQFLSFWLSLKFTSKFLF